MEVKETDLFKKFSILLLDRNKERFDDLKEKLSMISNVKLDNSGFFRAIIEYLFEHQTHLPHIVSYVVLYKGFTILESFQQMVSLHKTPEEIENQLGVSIEHYRTLQKKYEDDLSLVKETDLFKRYNLLFLDQNKKHFDILKIKLSQQAQVKLDNSGLVRATTEFLYENQEILEDIAKYSMKYKGFTLLEEFMRMINENRSLQEIESEIGVSILHMRDMEKKYGQSLKKTQSEGSP
ncbi:hypothetical protein ACFVS2_21470 [Brevibacillus sp. NPDC058079]|uniref:hypothetical protein n=1 Tax=Brevibacillus sp. NPDC058079 TaxID=3346330 RepID=UPI0036F04B83